LNGTSFARGFGSRGRTPSYDLIKMDADGPEGGWLRVIAKLVSSRRLVVGALIVEGSHLEAATMVELQQLGYHAWRLDASDGRRFMTRSGWDAYSPSGTFAPLDRLRDVHVKMESRRTKYSPLGCASRLRVTSTCRLGACRVS
jgi:hypothetical protein